MDLLTELTEHCAHLLDVASAGFLLADPRGQLHLMAATSERTHHLELFQLQAEQGPCLDCYTTGRPISVADLRVDQQRWPQFVDAATNAGFASVHAVPMRAAGTVLGALGLFGTHVGELNDADLLVGQTLAHIACVAILQEHAPTPETVQPTLRGALTRRVVVEQAKGFLGEHLGMAPEDAFTLLRRYARHHHEHMTDVAQQLLADPGTRPVHLERMKVMVDNRP